jgi:hypothetical protein
MVRSLKPDDDRCTQYTSGGQFGACSFPEKTCLTGDGGCVGAAVRRGRRRIPGRNRRRTAGVWQVVIHSLRSERPENSAFLTGPDPWVVLNPEQQQGRPCKVALSLRERTSHLRKWSAHGDISVWPFISRSEMATSRRPLGSCRPDDSTEAADRSAPAMPRPRLSLSVACAVIPPPLP